MKYFFMLSLIFSINSFAKNGDLAKLNQCKKEVNKLRGTYVHTLLDQERYFLKHTIYFDVQYWVHKSFLYRPWLMEKSIEKKITACEELKMKMRLELHGPVGIEEEKREVMNASEAHGDRHIVESFSDNSNI